jgi:O-antigen ligase
VSQERNTVEVGTIGAPQATPLDTVLRAMQGQEPRALPPGPGTAANPALPGGGKVWTPSFMALLLYVFIIHSYKLPIASATMILAVVATLASGKPRFPAPLMWFGAFLLWATIGATQSGEQDLVWKLLWERWKVWLIFFTAVNAIRSPAQLRLFIVLYLGCFALYPVRGTLYNVLIHEPGPRGRYAWNFVFSNPNDLATFCILNFGLILVVLQSAVGRWQRIAAFLGVVIIPVVIIITQSRAGFLGLLAMGSLVLLRTRPNAKIIAMGVVAAVAVAIAAPPEVWERIGGLTKLKSQDTVAEADPEGSAEERYKIWKVAAAMAADNPVFGVGIGVYPQVHAHYAAQREEWKEARGARATHSTYLNILAETGFPGLLLYLTFLFSVFRILVRTRKEIEETAPVWANDLMFLYAALGGFMVAALFGIYQTLPFLYFFVTMATLLAMNFQRATRLAAFRAAQA